MTAPISKVTDAWFTGAGLGLFVHWDHASQQGLEVSWPLVGGIDVLPYSHDVPVAQYHSSAATFDPVAWDPKAFAVMARQLGATYAVLTAKHHSGYALWDTATSDFSVVKASPYGRDIVGPWVEALRAEGLRVGLYLSLSDWSHPDYPPFTEQDKPYRLGMSPPRPSPEQADRYIEDMRTQLTELLTSYGTVDLLWFDGGWERPVNWWRPKEIEAHIRALAPDIVINDRLTSVGDYVTPEQFVPAQPPDGPWETCLTMNGPWGWVPKPRTTRAPLR